LPLGGAAFVIVAALGARAPDVATLAAFAADGRCGVTFRRGVWHHPLLALADGDFAVIERQGLDVDCETATLEPGKWVVARGR
jgi:ureidoglycolate lyase